MLYKRFSDMQKMYDFSFSDQKRKYLVFSSPIVDLLKMHEELNGYTGCIPSEVLCHMIKGKINSFLGLNPWAWDLGGFSFTASSGRKYFCDFESNITNVYNRKTGKQAYKIINVKALRLVSFRPSAFYNESADISLTVGVWSCSAGSCTDAYIDEA